jgi:Protein of unknown function (DUF1488)
VADMIEPYHDDEANGVLFEVSVQGRRAQGYISCVLLTLLGGTAAQPENWVNLYRRNRPAIDAAVARRAAAEDWDTVMLRRSDLTTGE